MEKTEIGAEDRRKKNHGRNVMFLFCLFACFFSVLSSSVCVCVCVCVCVVVVVVVFCVCFTFLNRCCFGIVIYILLTYVVTLVIVTSV